MITTILIVIYILSVFLCRYTYRLCSSKHYNLWCDEDCRFSLLWIIPFVNTILVFSIVLFILNEKPNKPPRIISKWLNTDL